MENSENVIDMRYYIQRYFTRTILFNNVLNLKDERKINYCPAEIKANIAHDNHLLTNFITISINSLQP